MRRAIIISGLVLMVGVMIMVAWRLPRDREFAPRTPGILTRQQDGETAQAGSGLQAQVLPDSYERKYPPAQRAHFHVSLSQSAAVFVRATGVQIRRDSGWETYSEELRNEIWRLRSGTTQEMFVEIPLKHAEETWRAYVRYGTEIQGSSAFMAKAREAWKIRSFTNWNGTAWGGGRFAGQFESFSEEFSE